MFELGVPTTIGHHPRLYLDVEEAEGNAVAWRLVRFRMVRDELVCGFATVRAA